MFVGARADVYKQLAGVTQYPSTEGYIPTNNPKKRPDKYFQDIPEKHLTTNLSYYIIIYYIIYIIIVL